VRGAANSPRRFTTRLDEAQQPCQRAAVARARGVEQLDRIRGLGHGDIVAQRGCPPARSGTDNHLWHAGHVVREPVALLAHQGGWDEILMVLAPVLLFALLLRTANRRAERFAMHEDANDSTSDP
jgi:hypothetical protein